MLDKSILTIDEIVKDEYRSEVVRNAGAYASPLEAHAAVQSELEGAYDDYWFIRRYVEDEWKVVKTESAPADKTLDMMLLYAKRAAGDFLTLAAKIEKYRHSVEVWEDMEE